MRRWLEGAYCNTKGVAFCKRTTMGDTKTIHFFDDARCNSPTFNLRLLRRACLGFKQWCFPDGGFQAPQAMARRATFRSTIYGIWMFPKMGNPMEYVPIYIYIWFIVGNPMKIGVPLNHLFVHGLNRWYFPIPIQDA